MLTKRQAAALSFIDSFFTTKGYGPSYAEIGAHLKLVSRGSVQQLINGLEERGAIRRLPTKARSIEVIRKTICTCPTCGRPH